MPAGPSPSYTELAHQNVDLRALNGELRAALNQLQGEVAALQAEVAVLRTENAELKRRLGMTSQNSSKPPSSDSPFDKPAPKSLRGKSGRKPGGQQGHRGSTLTLVDDPHERVRHEPDRCAGCGAGLVNAREVGMERRQVFDLPPISVRVTEHQIITRGCECGTSTTGPTPDGVNAPVQYGPQITATALYLYAGQFLSKKRTAQALAELFGSPISEGTVAAMSQRAADRLEGFTEAVRDGIANAQVAGFDETGFRVDGKLHWVHCARTNQHTLITCHPKRGRQGIDDAGVLGRFSGVAVHDAWAPYDTYLGVDHQLCCAHALRELQGVIDTADPEAGCWATQARDALVAMQQHVKQAIAANTSQLDPTALAEQIHRYQNAAQRGIAETAARADALTKKHNALARRLLGRQDDYLRFTTDWRIPPDNNGSERDIRMIKLRQKISGCMRTLAGAKQFCAIRSYLSTAAKHGHTIFDTLVMLAEGQPWMLAPT